LSTTDTFQDLAYEVTGGVATITLDRPDRLNALREQTFEELAAALRRAGGDEHAGVVVLAGAGRAFCAGGDVNMARSVLTTEQAGRQHYFGRMLPVSDAIVAMDKPVVCAVHGACVGGGAELATFADYVVADETAFFLFNGTSIGGCSWWGAQLLPLQVGLRRAEEVLYFSERVDAAEAARIGMINRVVPAGRLADETATICERLLNLSEDGLRLTKATMRSVKEGLLSSMSASAEMNVSALGKPDLHAAFDAFLAGRPMSWRDLRPAFRTDPG
jgi:enoyl-CoA hydratase/carnithine racemase